MKKTLLKLTALVAGILSLTACDKSPENTTTPKSKTVFVAGATGVIGEPLTKALVEKGYIVYGTTRSTDKAKILETNGVKPVVLDIYDVPAVEKAVLEAKPDVIISQLSSLPKGLKEEEMTEGLKRDNRIRVEGTRNLITAAEKAGTPKFITQSFVFYAPSEKAPNETAPLLDENDPVYGESTQAMKNLEAQTLAGKFTPVILRYGWIYGGKSGFDAPIEGYSTIHIDPVVDATVRAVEADLNGIYNVSESSPFVDVSKFQKAIPEWKDKK
ncbi:MULTISPECIES: NAD-dependent epimerase/dehydratase family protein [Rodentibacter]|uniref:NAD-dependent epimerase/dehydratase family protein n=1 Tax=Rodentibacter TaxID=1960084 RepID=UPI001CFDA1C5|nr:NAD(P)-dependent oxidoreductase [Rodentibacter sp. JRC1]GJI56021.1 dTDP-glucose 4,6-dehydratase [Rodentibacter sp. JRC1]